MYKQNSEKTKITQRGGKSGDSKSEVNSRNKINSRPQQAAGKNSLKKTESKPDAKISTAKRRVRDVSVSKDKFVKNRYHEEKESTEKLRDRETKQKAGKQRVYDEKNEPDKKPVSKERQPGKEKEEREFTKYQADKKDKSGKFSDKENKEEKEFTKYQSNKQNKKEDSPRGRREEDENANAKKPEKYRERIRNNKPNGEEKKDIKNIKDDILPLNMKQMFLISLVCFFLTSVSFLLMPFASEKASEGSKLYVIFTGLLFWLPLILGHASWIRVNHIRKKTLKQQQFQYRKLGVCNLFSNRWAVISDAVCLASLAGFILFMIFNQASYMNYICLFLGNFSLHSHSLFNGENYKWIYA